MKVRGMRRQFFVTFTLLILSLGLHSIDGIAQTRVRNQIKIPDIKGYRTLKCDFHLHTVFSDGNVWPVTRVEEAWREGLDVISITDHIEYQPHKNDLPTNHNRPYEIAKSAAAQLGILLIRGTEITRSTPPGHHNAIFLNDVNPLDTEIFQDALKAGTDQGAFIFYNHPGWKDPEGKAVWFPYQTELYDNGWLHGVEVVNGNSYYPLAHAWCLEKNLTLIGNSDAHNPVHFDYDYENGRHRPVTLVFAKKKSAKDIKEALFKRRTVVYWKNYLIGEEKYLKPLFNESVEVLNPEITIKAKGTAYLQIKNTSEIPFELKSAGISESEYITCPASLTLYPEKTVLLEVKGKSAEFSGKKKIRLRYTVENLLVAPETGLSAELSVRVTFIPAD